MVGWRGCAEAGHGRQDLRTPAGGRGPKRQRSAIRGVAPSPPMLCDGKVYRAKGAKMRTAGTSEGRLSGGAEAPLVKSAAPAAGYPVAEGLFDPSHERDSCGVGFIVNLHNQKSHRIIEDGLRILENLEHRGATGADPLMGDGAGILVQIPHAFFAGEADRLGFALPRPGDYAVGFIFMPRDPVLRADMEKIVEAVIEEEGKTLLGWRDVPVDNAPLSTAPEIAATEPAHRQVFIGRGPGIVDEDDFERKLYIARKVMSSRIYGAYGGLHNDFYIVSLSCRTIVYKGMFLAFQLGAYYRDLH